jgi:hypothetical protein
MNTSHEFLPLDHKNKTSTYSKIPQNYGNFEIKRIEITNFKP